MYANIQTLMATTVRISEESNRTIDEIQARILLLTKRRLSKQDVLQLILEVGPDIDRLARRVVGLVYPLPAGTKRRVRRRVQDWGVETREEDVNRALYGWDG